MAFFEFTLQNAGQYGSKQTKIGGIMVPSILKIGGSMVPSRIKWGHADIWFKILYKCRTYLRFKESKVLTNGSKLPSIKTKLTIKQKSISKTKFFLDFQEILGIQKTMSFF